MLHSDSGITEKSQNANPDLSLHQGRFVLESNPLYKRDFSLASGHLFVSDFILIFIFQLRCLDLGADSAIFYALPRKNPRDNKAKLPCFEKEVLL